MNAFTGTSTLHSKQRECDAYNLTTIPQASPMSQIEELAERVERLLVRHQELQRTNALLVEQLQSVCDERDHLRSRLNAARSRIDVLLERLPRDPAAPPDGAVEQPRSGMT